jgi:hypothetical protein
MTTKKGQGLRGVQNDERGKGKGDEGGGLIDIVFVYIETRVGIRAKIGVY